MDMFDLRWQQWRKIPAWIFGPRYFWFFVLGIAAASLLGDWLGIWWGDPIRENRIRFSGWILDTLGLVSIAMGISAKLDQFRERNLLEYAWDRFYEWLRSFPLLVQHHKVLPGHGELKIGPSTARGFGQVRINENRPIEEQVTWLLQKFYNLTDTVHETRRDLDEQAAALRDRIDELERSLSTELEAVKQQSVEVGVGDVGKEFVGLFWIFAGITFATVPEFVEFLFADIIEFFEALGRLISGPG